jgi:hypothetical protein
MQFGEFQTPYGWPGSAMPGSHASQLKAELAFSDDVRLNDVSMECAPETRPVKLRESSRAAPMHKTFDFERTKEKYEASMKSEIDKATTNPSWIYSWLYIDLQEFELTNKLKHGLESKNLQKMSLPTKADRVQKIRDRLAYLQTQTVSIVLQSFRTDFPFG